MICHLCKNGHWIQKDVETINNNGILVLRAITLCSNPDCNYKREKWICTDYKISVVLFDDHEIETEEEVVGQWEITRATKRDISC